MSDINDQFSSLLNSLHSSSLQPKELPSSPPNEENLFVWQPVPFTKLKSPASTVVSVEPPSTIVSLPPPNHQNTISSIPSLSVPQILAPSNLSTSNSLIATPPPSFPPSFVPSHPQHFYQPQPSFIPDYYSQSIHPVHQHAVSYPPSIASQGSYPIKYFSQPNFQNHLLPPPQLHVNEMELENVRLPQPVANNLPVVKEALHLKTQPNTILEKSTPAPVPSSLVWFLYVAGFLLILVLVFTALWYFYVKDYNKYKLKNKNEKEENEEDEEEFNNKHELLPPPSIIKENFLNEINLENIPEMDLNEVETLIKEESSEEEEYFEPKKILEFLEKKKPGKKSYFDLSDVDSSEFIPQAIEKKVHTGGKLSDESPEVNEYAEKRANSLK